MIISLVDFNKNPPKNWNSTERHLFNKTIGNFDSIINSNLESAKNNFGVEYPIEDSTLESVGVDSKLFNLESAYINFDMESTQEDSIPKSQVANFIIDVIMIDCVFIQTNTKRIGVYLYFRNDFCNWHQV
jgi:hypothetical protein